VVRAADPLPSWNETATKKAVIAFLEGVTKEGSPDFVPFADEELLSVIAPVRETSPRMAFPHFDFAYGNSGVVRSRNRRRLAARSSILRKGILKRTSLALAELMPFKGVIWHWQHSVIHHTHVNSRPTLKE